MRLCFVSTDDAVDGVFVRRLARLLAREHEVTLVHAEGSTLTESWARLLGR